jgi:hypothetical protein
MRTPHPESWLTEPIALQMLYRIARRRRDIMADLGARWVGSDEQPAIRFDRQRVDAVEQGLQAAGPPERGAGTVAPPIIISLGRWGFQCQRAMVTGGFFGQQAAAAP